MTPVELVGQFIEAINRGDVETMMSLSTDSYVLIDGGGERFTGDKTLRTVWATYFSWFPDYRITIEEIVAAGETVVVLGHAGATYAPDGELRPENRWHTPVAWRATVRNQSIECWQVYGDTNQVREIMKRRIQE